MYRDRWACGLRPTGSILTCSLICCRSARTMSVSLLALRFDGAILRNKRTSETATVATWPRTTCGSNRVRRGLTMTPQTLNDIFFAIVERGQERLMLVRDGSRWTPISAQEF